MIPKIIQMCLDYMGFSKKELILSGLSMGSFGATYYGAELNPHAILLANSVFSLKRVAQLGNNSQSGLFETSLDFLLSLEGSLEESAVRRLANRF